MWPTTLLIVYCSLIVLASLAGGWLPSLIRLTHRRMHVLMSGVAGLMLGVGLFHMLPHSYAHTDSIDLSVGWMVAGLLLMFFLIRTFQFHQHDVVSPHDLPHAGDSVHHDHRNSVVREGNHGREAFSRRRLSWLGVAVGLAVHSLIDGMALAASVQAEAVRAPYGTLLGLGTFLAILLHKPLDALSITSLMLVGGWPIGYRQAVNAGFAVMCPVGAGLFALSLAQFSNSEHLLVGCAPGFSAGVFLCISLGDLLPELQFHTHDRFKLSAALLLGVLTAYGIGFLEPRQVHSPQHSAAPQSSQHNGERHENRGGRIED